MEERLRELLLLAKKYSATDIHFTLRNGAFSLEMRIDGSIKKVKTRYGDERLIRYLQYLANLDLASENVPQTGQFEMELDNVRLYLRFALLRENNGMVNGVLRILNNSLGLRVDNLTSDKKQVSFFKSLINHDSGLVLFSGPTGSGKTTTLYTLLKEVRGKKIISIEDPIEVSIDNIIQIQVNEKIGLDYKSAIAQALRHDPDIIMIGEIRDSKAAQMATVAANTGHLVFSTIHTSKADSCLSRMIELGVDENHLYENLLALVNQRLLNNLVEHKKKVVYEIMDKQEIEYFKENKKHSKEYIDISKRISEENEKGYF